MSLIVSEIKKPLYWGLAWVLTLINFVTFIVSRNEFWLTHPGQAWLAASATEDRTYLASEFERNLSCYAPFTCLRSGGAFISNAFIKITIEISRTTRVDLTVDQQTFIILIGGLVWRVFCLAILVFAVTKLFNSYKFGLLVGNVIMFLLSGLPLWQLGQVLVKLPLDLSPFFIGRVNEAFIHMSFGDLVFYDYGFFALVPLTALALSKITNLKTVSGWKFFTIGLFVASFYEAFVPIIFLSITIMLFKQEKKFLFQSLGLFAGQFAWIIFRIFTLRFTEAADPRSPFFIGGSFGDFLNYASTSNKGISTTSSLPSIAIQLILISFLAVAIGFFVGLITKKYMDVEPIDNQTLRSISATTTAVTVLILLSFLRPVYVETGRQSLGLSIVLVIFSFSYPQRINTNDESKSGI